MPSLQTDNAGISRRFGPSEITWSCFGSNVTRYVPSVTPMSAFCAAVGTKGEVRTAVVTCDALDGAIVFESTVQALEATTTPPQRTRATMRKRLENFIGRFRS